MKNDFAKMDSEQSKTKKEIKNIKLTLAYMQKAYKDMEKSVTNKQ